MSDPLDSQDRRDGYADGYRIGPDGLDPAGGWADKATRIYTPSGGYFTHPDDPRMESNYDYRAGVYRGNCDRIEDMGGHRVLYDTRAERRAASDAAYEGRSQ